MFKLPQCEVSLRQLELLDMVSTQAELSSSSSYLDLVAALVGR